MYWIEDHKRRCSSDNEIGNSRYSYDLWLKNINRSNNCGGQRLDTMSLQLSKYLDIRVNQITFKKVAKCFARKLNENGCSKSTS